MCTAFLMTQKAKNKSKQKPKNKKNPAITVLIVVPDMKQENNNLIKKAPKTIRTQRTETRGRKTDRQTDRDRRTDMYTDRQADKSEPNA